MTRRIAYSLALLCAASAASQPQTDWQAAAGGKMSFDVASVKPAAQFRPPRFPLDAGDGFTPTGGDFRATFPLPAYIAFAYKITQTPAEKDAMLAHLPKWVESDTFEIEARAPANVTKDQLRLMMQSLLADRFKLAVHFETRESSEFALVVTNPGKLGPNLKPHTEGPACPDTADVVALGAPSATDAFPRACRVFGITRAPGGPPRLRWGSRDSSLAALASMLPSVDSGAVDKPVVDQTGLSGTFDFLVDYAVQPEGPAPFGVEPDPSGPTFLEALREQLGLKLVSTKGPVQTLVIDRVERPSAN